MKHLKWALVFLCASSAIGQNSPAAQSKVQRQDSRSYSSTVKAADEGENSLSSPSAVNKFDDQKLLPDNNAGNAGNIKEQDQALSQYHRRMRSRPNAESSSSLTFQNGTGWSLPDPTQSNAVETASPQVFHLPGDTVKADQSVSAASGWGKLPAPVDLNSNSQNPARIGSSMNSLGELSFVPGKGWVSASAVGSSPQYGLGATDSSSVGDTQFSSLSSHQSVFGKSPNQRNSSLTGTDEWSAEQALPSAIFSSESLAFNPEISSDSLQFNPAGRILLPRDALSTLSRLRVDAKSDEQARIRDCKEARDLHIFSATVLKYCGPAAHPGIHHPKEQ
ncbi:MAG TPA: hypothetical protein VGL89_09840 [Candidatus Koribacter sp.]|jgi:hypothetical protein